MHRLPAALRSATLTHITLLLRHRRDETICVIAKSDRHSVCWRSMPAQHRSARPLELLALRVHISLKMRAVHRLRLFVLCDLIRGRDHVERLEKSGNWVGRAAHLHRFEFMAIAAGIAAFLSFVLDVDLPFLTTSEEALRD
jgi:hypothetical protein